MNKRTSPTPVILDTDIGSDIDDTWALVMMLKCPELDVKLVASCTGDTQHRAQLLAKLLEVAERTDIPVGVGKHFGPQKKYPQAAWLGDYALSDYPGTVHEDGVDAIIRTIMDSPAPVTLICIGPLPNIGEALRREPAIARKARFVGMHGSVRRGYGNSEQISKECNVVNNTPDCRQAFTAEWEMTITPLDTCGLVTLKDDRYQAIRRSADPLVQALIENYRVWLQGNPRAEIIDTNSSVLFDTVAVHLAYSTDYLLMEELGIRVSDDGYTMIDENAKRMQVATEWTDLEGFRDELVKRLLAPTVAGKMKAEG